MKFGLYCKGSNECINVHKFIHSTPKQNQLYIAERIFSNKKNLEYSKFIKLFEVKQIHD